MPKVLAAMNASTMSSNPSKTKLIVSPLKWTARSCPLKMLNPTLPIALLSNVLVLESGNLPYLLQMLLKNGKILWMKMTTTTSSTRPKGAVNPTIVVPTIHKRWMLRLAGHYESLTGTDTGHATLTKHTHQHKLIYTTFSSQPFTY
jgi:hypothetical protein